jgi:SulP family sulfate permease
VREQTQELASWALGESPSYRPATIRSYHPSSASDSGIEARPTAQSLFEDSEQGEERPSIDSSRADITEDVIEEVSEPVTPENEVDGGASLGQTSTLTELMRETVSRKRHSSNVDRDSGFSYIDSDRYSVPSVFVDDIESAEATEATPLIPRERIPRMSESSHKAAGYYKPQKAHFKSPWAKFRHETESWIHTASHPKEWDVKRAVHDGTGALAAVFLGLLLNVLDALSYGELALGS